METKFKVGDKFIQKFPYSNNVTYLGIIKSVTKTEYCSDYYIKDPRDPRAKIKKVVAVSYFKKTVEKNSFLVKGKLIEALYL